MPQSADEYIESLPEERREVMRDLRDAINQNIPEGFEERVSPGSISWVVPHELYPAGYHCDPAMPLGLITIASQKGHIAVYHMGVYASVPLLEWFRAEWPKHSARKLDMGKSCIRFKKPEHVTVPLIGELAAKLSPSQWIQVYEKALGR